MIKELVVTVYADSEIDKHLLDVAMKQEVAPLSLKLADGSVFVGDAYVTDGKLSSREDSRVVRTWRIVIVKGGQ